MVKERPPRKGFRVAAGRKDGARRSPAERVEQIASLRRPDDREATLPAASDAENSVQWLLRIAHSRSLLSARDELELARRIAEGDEDARRRLTESNLRLVVSVARRYANYGVPLADLVQEGIVGLMRAIEKFDYHRGYRFSTYATWWIRQAVSRAVMEQRRLLRLPVHVSEALYRLDRVSHQLAQDLGREPTEDEVARAFGEPPARVQELLRVAADPLSLDTPMGEDEDLRIEDLLESASTDTGAAAVDRLIHQEEVAAILERLSPRERDILTLRYGLAGEEPKTLEEIGERFGLTRERIRQIEDGAVRKIRHAGREGLVQR